MERHVKFFTFLLHNFLALHFYYLSSYCFTLSSVYVICSKWLGTLSQYDTWILFRHLIVKCIYNKNFEVQMKLLQFNKVWNSRKFSTTHVVHVRVGYHSGNSNLLWARQSGVWTLVGARNFLFSYPSRLVLKPTQPPLWWLLGLPWEKSGHGMALPPIPF